jgi:ABC-2 type transport system ATP-binding protein
VLEDASFHPGRSGRNHLRVLAAAGEHPDGRVDEVLRIVGLADAADRLVKGYSLGMRQRLALAAALLGDPEVLVLDEPANGLDPPGIRWLRDLMRHQASEGRAVLVSSHVLAEVAQSADEVVVIARGRLRAQGPIAEVLGGADGAATFVRSPDAERLARTLAARGLRVEPAEPSALLVHGTGPETVGRAAGEEGITLFELYARSRSLEDAFFELTGEEG